MRRWLPFLLSFAMLSTGCPTARQASAPSQTESTSLESRCLAYHLEHHHEDEQAAKVAGEVEFTGYRILVGHVEVGEALVGIKVVSQKTVWFGCGVDGWWESAGRDVDWQERWSNTKDGWVFDGRVGNPVGLFICQPDGIMSLEEMSRTSSGTEQRR